MPADRLERQLAGLQFPLDQTSRGDLQRCVCEYVDTMKAQQWTAERVLVGLKRIAADAGIRGSVLSGGDHRESRAALLTDMVAWSIERYYGDEPDGERGD